MNRRTAPEALADTEVPDRSASDDRSEGDPLDCPGLPPAGEHASPGDPVATGVTAEPGGKAPENAGAEATDTPAEMRTDDGGMS